jgi:prevent-host-death family protein
MEQVEASRVKQNFGEVLARAAREPLGVSRHGRVVAALVPAGWIAREHLHDERRAARAAQRQLEQDRLMRHQHIGIELLCAATAEQARILRAARREVDRWEAEGLCSRDYIERWREWLALPVRDLVRAMCSEAQGWGVAMRQNSPFTFAAA